MSSLSYCPRNGLAVVRINELPFIGPRTSPDIFNSCKCPVDHERMCITTMCTTYGDIFLTVGIIHLARVFVMCNVP